MKGLEIRTLFKATAEHPRHSEASVVELRDGRLLMAWIEFTRSAKEGGDHAPSNIACVTSRDGGTTWSNHRLLVRNKPGYLNVFSPNLLRLRNGDILFVYMRYIALADGIVPSVSCFMCRSRDDGRTFSEPSPIWTKKPWGYASGVLKQLSTGRILLPMDWQMGLVWSKMDHAAAGCVYSDDNGRTWNEPVSWVDLPLRGAMEAHVEELKDGRILMVLRTQLGSVFKCVSSDGGLTWTKPQTTGLKSPESCPELVRAPGAGDLVLFWNNGIYNPVADHFGRRTPLTVALSRDEGETWRIVRDIETNPERAFTNPGCLITSRNKVLLTYWTTPYDAHGRMTCKRIDLKLARFDLDWLYSA